MNNINDIRKNWGSILENFRNGITEEDKEERKPGDVWQSDREGSEGNWQAMNADGEQVSFGDDKEAAERFAEPGRQSADDDDKPADDKKEPGKLSGDDFASAAEKEPEKQWKRKEGEYTARYPEGDASVEDKVEALTDLWTQYKSTIDTDKRSAIKDKISKYTSWDDSDGGYSYALDLVDDVKSVKDVAKFVKKKEKWLEKRRKEAESGAETGSLSGDFYDSKPNVQGYSIDGYEDASKGQKAVMDIEFQLSQGISNDEAQDIADEIKNFWSADEVYAYYKDERDFSENDAVSLATAFAGKPYKGGERAGAVADNPDDFYDVPKADNKGDIKAPDDEWYGDDDQFDLGPGQEAEEVDRYATELADMFDDSDNVYDSIEDMLRSGAELPAGMDRTFIEDYIDDIADQAEEQKRQKFNKDAFGESFTNPFESKLLKSIIKGKK